ncbi:MAG: glycosyltransferase family 4 protein [Gemmatimonadaceae bacterium]|nr:glycosyltransferase family 4 protein [Gemmatimonadaceae bacterium]
MRLATALRAVDVRVHVIAPGAPGVPATDDFDGVTVDRFRYAPRRYENLAYTGTMAQDVATSWSARLALVGFFGAEFVRSLSAARSFEPDLIHAHWWFPSGVVATQLTPLSQKPLVTTLHGTDVRLAKSIGMSRLLFRHVMRRSSRVTTVSSWLASEVTKLVPVTSPTVAPMPVATEVFHPGSLSRSGRILFAGRLNRQKGLDHLIRALPLMRTPAALDVVGEGPSGTELRALAAELGANERIEWHGQLDRDALVGFYRTASVVVVPSTDEGLGLVAAEAQLCETPVIAFRSGGLTDVVQNHKTGVLVEPGDTAALASALDRVLAFPDEAAALGRAGRTFALSTFSPESAARQYKNIYEEALGERAT